MPGFTSSDPLHATLLQGTSALQCLKGVIGGAAGSVRDTLFFGVYILKNAGPAQVTVTGLFDSSGVAANFVILGSTTQDQFFVPPEPILNELAVYTFTPSVAATVWVFTRNYTGP